MCAHACVHQFVCVCVLKGCVVDSERVSVCVCLLAGMDVCMCVCTCVCACMRARVCA